MNQRVWVVAVGFMLWISIVDADIAAQDPAEIIKGAIDHWRGQSSYSEMTMTIHRPDWARSVSMRGWTQGDKRSLIRVTAPRKDRGNGTLTDDNKMWTFSPKVNRVIKIPSSMLGQSWMGSDFSNKEISRSDDIIEFYDHTLLGSIEVDGHTVYEIESVPHENAPVVWGKEVLKIRDDHVMLEEKFFDQDMQLVKMFMALEVGEMGGRQVAIRQRMGKVETPDEWTEITLDAVDYDVDLNDTIFTLSNLRNPRD